MQQSLLIAICAGLGGMIGWGLADFFAKKTIDEIGDIASLTWAHIFGTVVLALVVLYKAQILKQNITIPHDVLTWGLLSFFGALQAVVYLLVYKAFGKGQVAVLNPIFASFTGLVAIISIVVFGERVSGLLLPSFIVIFAGIICINIDTHAFRARRIKWSHVPGLKEIGLATLLAALWTISWDKFIGGKDWVSYAFFMYAFMTITVFLFSKIQRKKLRITKSSMWIFLILIGICEVVAYLMLSLGYSTTPFTSIIALLSGAFSLPTIILARIFLKEKVTMVQTIGSIIIIMGIIILSIH